MNERSEIKITGSEIAAAITGKEYRRLLSMPRELEGDLLERAITARAWYAFHGIPFVATCRMQIADTNDTGVTLSDGTILQSVLLARRLRVGEAHAIVIMAASAGIEVAKEASLLWAERPDEAFFLDRFAVAVTERLVFSASALLCRKSEPAQETLLPHLSPGCGNWDLSDQHKLMNLLTGGGTQLGPVVMLSSGALDPQHSVLAAMGVTHRNYAATPEAFCRSCDLNPCKFRRAPYSHSMLLPAETMQ